MKRIVILGAGTAGTMMANRLANRYKHDLATGRVEIVIVDKDDNHVYQPGLLFIPFGIYDDRDTVKPRRNQVNRQVKFVDGEIDRVDAQQNLVVLDDARELEYDVLIVATGSRIVPEETEGMLGEGWGRDIFDFYTSEGANALAQKLESWDSGHLVLNVVDMPIKCPIAPLEFVFLADWFFTKRGVRDRVKISFVTPLDGAFTRPLAAAALGHLLEEKNIELVREFATGEVNAAENKIVSWDEREINYDLLVSVPVHMGADFIARSPGLGDDMNWVKTDPNTLQAEVAENVFALGDTTNLATSKAGSVAHFQAEILEDNVAAFFAGRNLAPEFDGHANCFIETGFNKAVLIDFNYDVEPLPGKFPFRNVGPLALLKESYMNHVGKMAFKWIYWNMLLPGRPLPGITPRMSMVGKKQVNLATEAA